MVEEIEAAFTWASRWTLLEYIVMKQEKWSFHGMLCHIQGVPKKKTPMLSMYAGLQTDQCWRRNPCPEKHNLGAVQRRSLRTNGCQNLFWCPNTAGMQPFSHLWTSNKMCGITSTLHIQINGLVEGNQFCGQRGRQIWYRSLFSVR